MKSKAAPVAAANIRPVIKKEDKEFLDRSAPNALS
jgi:hypothetical protein